MSPATALPAAHPAHRLSRRSRHPHHPAGRPLYATTFGASALDVGLLFTVFSAAQFLATPLLGALSDRHGRRPVLLAILLGEAAGYVLMGVAPNLAVLYVSRVVTGVTAGNVGAAQAYLADLTPPEERTRTFGCLGAAFALGFLAGPAIRQAVAAAIAESERQIALSIRHQCLLARSFARAGFVPVLEYAAVNHRLLARYQSHLRRQDLHLVVLDPGPEVALDCDRQRPEKTVAHLWVHMHDELRRELTGLGLWIDSSRLTAELTVEFIIEHRVRARLAGTDHGAEAANQGPTDPMRRAIAPGPTRMPRG